MGGTYRAKLFRTGGSQAVRLPKECRLSGAEVLVHREGERVILEPLRRRWSADFLSLLRGPSDEESFPDREQPTESEEREELE